MFFTISYTFSYSRNNIAGFTNANYYSIVGLIIGVGSVAFMFALADGFA